MSVCPSVSTWDSWDEACRQPVALEQAAHCQNHPDERLHYTGAIGWAKGVMIGYGVGPAELTSEDAPRLLRWTCDVAGFRLLGQWGTEDSTAWAVAIWVPRKADEWSVRRAWGDGRGDCFRG
jgi:hypothetical protein